MLRNHRIRLFPLLLPLVVLGCGPDLDIGGGGSPDDGETSASLSSFGQDGSAVAVTVTWSEATPIRLRILSGDWQEIRTIRSPEDLSQRIEIPRSGFPLREIAATLQLETLEGEILDSAEMMVVEPLDFPDGPLLALNQADLNTLLPRYNSDSREAGILNEMVDRCAERLQEELYIPDIGGAWGAFYACPVHGAMLEYVTDTEHRCPVGGETYSGSPYDDVVASLRHRDLAVSSFEHALAWLLTNNMQHAERVSDIIHGYALKYPNYEFHDRFGGTELGGAKVFAQSLDEAEWLTYITRSWDLIRGSESYTEAQELEIIENIFIPSTQLIANNPLGTVNIQCWHNSAIFLASLLSKDFIQARDAVHGDNGILTLLADGVRSDGLWHEGSFGYHFFAIRGMLPSLQAIRRIEHEADFSTIVEMLKAPYAAMLPPGKLPMLNDGSEQDFTGMLREVYEHGIGLFRSEPILATPLLIWGRGNTVESVLYGPNTLQNMEWEDIGSSLLPDSGLACLRSGPPQQRSLVLMDFGPHGGHHGHPDKLGLTLWLEGQPAFIEAGSIGYGTDLYRGWYKRSLAHNTVLVNGRDQKECTGDFVRWESEDGTSTVVASSSLAYPGSQLTRLSHLTSDGIYVDLFRVDSQNKRVYDYVLHGVGTVQISANLKPGETLYGGAYAHLTDVRVAQVDDDFEVIFQTESGSQTLRVLGEPQTQVILARAPGHPAGSDHPILIVRRFVKATTFASVVTSGTSLADGITLSLESGGEAAWFTKSGQSEPIRLPFEEPSP